MPPDQGSLGGPSNGVPVIPPFRADPKAIPKDIGLTYFPGTDHSGGHTHIAWNQGQYDLWATTNGPITMSYMTRTDVPYHCALADAFTVVCCQACQSLAGASDAGMVSMISVPVAPLSKSELPGDEVAGGNVDAFIPTPSQVLIGLPKQEKGLIPCGGWSFRPPAVVDC